MVRNNQTGDTIVEVLIAIVVVSSVLVGAFSISNLSLKQIRMAQERGEAQEIAKQSTENLNSMIKFDDTLLTRTTPFCKSATTFGAVDVTDVACSSGSEGRYKTTITKDNPGDVTDFGFRVNVSWPGLTGSLQEVTINYRVKTTD